ncbi:MAG: hypothetical protein OEN20_07450 [Gammaproteobacteria bacterium]|nr:hypothetical protein [Gammaproteobacteria bacterium]
MYFSSLRQCSYLWRWYRCCYPPATHRASLGRRDYVARTLPAVAIPAATTSRETLLLAIACFGGLALPTYALAIAHANDFLAPQAMVAAIGGLVLASGVGAVLGPVSASALMELFGAVWFWWSLAAIHAFVGLFALYRMLRRAARPLADQGEFHPPSARASTVAVDWTHDAQPEDEQLPTEGPSAPSGGC